MWSILCIVFLVTSSSAHEHDEACDDVLQLVGWNSAAHTSFDPAGWTVIFSGKEIPCDGYVTQWMYWAKVSQPFRGIVLRPTDQDNVFTVVGINDISAGAINQAVIYTVPKDERIEARQGDVIGLGWSDASPQTTWTTSCNGAAQVRWYRDSDPSDLAPGDTATTTGVQDRCWSFSALVTSKLVHSHQASFRMMRMGKLSTKSLRREVPDSNW
ncbi:uncharacterized protein [Amphiura filiformis]|uniref:uncharacterized protein n=1 Tax=Amphiura filiformis TaxID=82378 RepID=UPI003B21311D